MGLALVKAIVHRHEGTVELRSRLGEGTSVRIRLLAVARR
jgi:signal transduction histidine kinase